MKKLFSSTLIVGMLLSASSAHAFKIEIPGIKLPPPSEWEIPLPNIPPPSKWEIGGEVGRAWEHNKEAIKYATIGTSLLGPVGWIAGGYYGFKSDQAKRAAKRAFEKMHRDRETIKLATERFKEQADVAANKYITTSDRLEKRNAPQEAFDRLANAHIEFVWCLASSNNSRDADDCVFLFEDESNEIFKDYR